MELIRVLRYPKSGSLARKCHLCLERETAASHGIEIDRFERRSTKCLESGCGICDRNSDQQSYPGVSQRTQHSAAE